jgi:RNA polymerase sigma factor (TIGR02999 family)
MNQVAEALDTIECRATDAPDYGLTEELLPLVYDELRRLAAHQLARERPGQTLQATALVHEAWLRLSGDRQRSWQSRRHFFFAAAEVMRRILIDQARRKARVRHGGGMKKVEFQEVEIAAPGPETQLLAVNEALERLEKEDPRKAELVKLHYFVGLTLEQAADVLGVSTPTAKRYWAYARAWLYQEITSNS